MTKLRIKFLVLLVFLFSCNSKWDETLLHGNWVVYDWTVAHSGQKVTQQMDFTFNNDKTYEIDYGSENELGEYYLAGEYLHTKEEGSIDKSVRIRYLNQDTFQFEMNRAGSLELVTLLRP